MTSVFTYVLCHMLLTRSGHADSVDKLSDDDQELCLRHSCCLGVGKLNVPESRGALSLLVSEVANAVVVMSGKICQYI